MASSKKGITVLSDIQINDDSVKKVKRVHKETEKSDITKKLANIENEDLEEDLSTAIKEDNAKDIAFNPAILSAIKEMTESTDQEDSNELASSEEWVQPFADDEDGSTPTLDIHVDEDELEEEDIDLLEEDEDEIETADHVDLLKDDEEEISDDENLSLGSTDLLRDEDYEDEEEEKEESLIEGTEESAPEEQEVDDALASKLRTMSIPAEETDEDKIALQSGDSLLGEDLEETEKMIKAYSDKINNTEIAVDEPVGNEDEQVVATPAASEVTSKGVKKSQPVDVREVKSVIEDADKVVSNIDRVIHEESKANAMGIDEEEMVKIAKSARIDVKEVERNKAIIHGSSSDIKGYYKNTIGQIELEEKTIDPVFSPTEELLNSLSQACDTELAILADKRTLTDALTLEISTTGKYYVEVENKEYSSAAMPAGTELIKRGEHLFCAFTSVPENYTGYRKPLKAFIAALQKAIRSDLFEAGIATFQLVDENGINILTVNEFKLIDQFLTKNKLVHRIAGTELIITC